MKTTKGWKSGFVFPGALGAFVLAFSAGPGALAGQRNVNAHDGLWNGYWDRCYDVHTIGFDERLDEFKKLLVDGKAWDRAVETEKNDIDYLTGQTCVRWAPESNGHTALAEFRDRYGHISKQALLINDKARGYLLAKLKEWTTLQQEEVATLRTWPNGEANLTWEEHFPCSQAFQEAEKHIEEQVNAVAGKFGEVRRLCPHAADDLIREAISKGRPSDSAFGNWGDKQPQQLAPKGTSPAAASDITGAPRAIEQEKESDAILRGK